MLAVVLATSVAASAYVTYAGAETPERFESQENVARQQPTPPGAADAAGEYLDDWRSGSDPLATLASFAQRAVAEMQRAAPDDPVTMRLVRWRDELCGGSVRSCMHSMARPAATPGVTNEKKDIRMCLDRDDGTIEGLRDAMFVLLHEMAHVATVELQHVPEFWHNFQFLLKTLSDAGVYTPEDYASAPARYCDFPITSSSLECAEYGACPLGGV